MSDTIDAAGIVAAICKPLDFKDDVRNGLYAEVPVGQNFTGYYNIHDLDAFDMWQVDFGVHCHEFGDSLVWKGTGRDKAVQAAQEHNRARIAAALDVGKIVALVGALEPFAQKVRQIRQNHMSGHVTDDDEMYVKVGALRKAYDTLAAFRGDAAGGPQG